MNDSEVTMHDTRHPADLTVYRTALEAAATAIALVRRVPAPLKSLADQVIRCASSVPANPRSGGVRVRPSSQREDGSDRSRTRVGRRARSARATSARAM
ncbi:MAG TPA: hypothetical protein VLB51_01270, partial [Methylomirabilota bacterium]|nr:hypothetical protein [Methylomirabilota bacterium]